MNIIYIVNVFPLDLTSSLLINEKKQDPLMVELSSSAIIPVAFAVASRVKLTLKYSLHQSNQLFRHLRWDDSLSLFGVDYFQEKSKVCRDRISRKSSLIFKLSWIAKHDLSNNNIFITKKSHSGKVILSHCLLKNIWAYSCEEIIKFLSRCSWDCLLQNLVDFITTHFSSYFVRTLHYEICRLFASFVRYFHCSFAPAFLKGDITAFFKKGFPILNKVSVITPDPLCLYIYLPPLGS